MPILRRAQPGLVALIAPASQPGAGLPSNLPPIQMMSTRSPWSLPWWLAAGRGYDWPAPAGPV